MAKNKIYRKSVSVINSKHLDSDLQTLTAKWKRKLASLFNIPIIDEYLYSFNIQYNGTVRLKENDTLVSQQGIYFLVFKEINRQAIIVTAEKSPCKPFVLGRFTILDMEKEIKFAKAQKKLAEQRAKDEAEKNNKNTK